MILCLIAPTAINPLHADPVWKPGQGWTEANVTDKSSASGSKDQLTLAQAQEDKGDLKEAEKTYKELVRRWPLSVSAAEAQFNLGKLAEKKGDFWGAYLAYQKMIQKYPASAFFEKALEREYEIGNLYLAGEPQRIWKIPVGPSMEKTVEIYQSIIKNAPYGKYAAQSQFKIGLANENEKKYADAVKAYNLLIDKYPNSEMIESAQYQIGYAWMKAASQADYDQSSGEKSVEAFQDFLARYPTSEKAAAAQENISQLNARRTEGALHVAEFYEKQGNKKGALIYYSEVLRQNPTPSEAQIAKAKIQELQGATNKEPVKISQVSSTTTTSSDNPGSTSSSESPTQ